MLNLLTSFDSVQQDKHLHLCEGAGEGLEVDVLEKEDSSVCVRFKFVTCVRLLCCPGCAQRAGRLERK